MGQKLIILAILLNILVIVLGLVGGSALGPIRMLFPVAALATLVISLVGVVRMSGGLGFGIGLQVLFCLLMFIPLINLLTLLILNGKATGALRANGYKVGLFGAKAID